MLATSPPSSPNGASAGAIRQQPIIKRTYGRLKPADSTITTSKVADGRPGLEKHDSYLSDLTSLSQLTGASTLKDSEDDDGKDEDEAKNESSDSGYHSVAQPKKSLEEQLKAIDRHYDASSSPVNQSKSFTNDSDADMAADTSLLTTLPSSAPAPNTLSSPTRPTITKQGSPVEDNAADLPSSPVKPVKSSTNKKIIDSDEESDNEGIFTSKQAKPIASDKHDQDDKDDEEEDKLPELADAFKPSGHSASKKKARRVVLDSDDEEEDDAHPATEKKEAREDSEDDSDGPKRQESEEIEQYQESMEDAGHHASMLAKKGSKTKSKDVKDGKKPKPLSKAELAEMYRESANLQRSQVAFIPKKSKPAKTLSEIIPSSHPSSNSILGNPARPISSMHRPLSLTKNEQTAASTSARARSLSVRPSNTGRFGSLAPLPSRLPNPAASSSIVFEDDSKPDFSTYNDNDSMDLTFLQSLPETNMDSISQSSSNKHQKLNTTSPIIEDSQLDNAESDEELPDIDASLENERRMRSLQEKKKSAALKQEENATAARKTKGMGKGKGKGKGRALSVGVVSSAQPTMDLSDSDDPIRGKEEEGDEDDDDLEIVLPRPATPKIERKRDRKINSALRKLPHSGVKIKRAEDDIITDSQFHMAGRSFGVGGNRTVVNPHIDMGKKGKTVLPLGGAFAGQKATGSNTQRKKVTGQITQKSMENRLLDQARYQGMQSRKQRQEDWRRGGGTLRKDNNGEIVMVHYGNTVADQEREEAGIEEGKAAKALLETMRLNAVKTGQASGDGEDEVDDKEDEDYVASDEEEELGSAEEDLGSGDEMGSADEEDDAASNADVPLASASEMQDDATSSSPIVVAARTTFVRPIASEGSTSPSQDDTQKTEIIPSHHTLKPLEANMDLSSSPMKEKTATQYHEFVVKDNANAFPVFDGSIEDISLTQIFGAPDANTQAAPQASRAVFGEGEGFSQFFNDSDGAGFENNGLQPTPTQLVPGTMPDMFKKKRNLQESPVVQRHIIGEAPMILDAALRDAEIREEAERAYYAIQQKKLQAQAEVERHPLDSSTTTPGSVISEDLPPVPHVSDTLVRFNDAMTPSRGGDMMDSDEDENKEDQVRLPRAGQPTISYERETKGTSSGEDDDDEEDQASPSVPRKVLKLRRAGEERQSGSPEPHASKPQNAFDVLKQGMSRALSDKERELRKKAKQSEFLAGEASESEDEGPYAMLRKNDEDDGGDESDSDLDKDVEELVDNQQVDAETEEVQDALAMEKHRQQLEADEERLGKKINRIVEGKTRRSKRQSDDLMDDSDYEDDEANFYRKARVKKSKTYNSKIEALAANDATKAFAEVTTKADDFEGLDCGFLQDNNVEIEPATESEAEDDEDEYMGTDEEDGDIQGYGRARKYKPTRQRTPDYDLVHALINGQSSPAFESNITVNNRHYAIFNQVKTTQTQSQKITVQNEFLDLEESYNIYVDSTHVRKTLTVEDGENQNDRGVGPGKSASVTYYAKMSAKSGDTGVRRQNSSTNLLPKSGGKALSRTASSLSSVSSGSSNKGRIALARQSSKMIK